MNINFEEMYLEKLQKYVGRKLNIIQKENEIEIIYDVETSYVLKENHNKQYSFYSIQRNEIMEIAEYYSEEEMKREFAIAIKGFFSEEIDYSGSDELETAKEMSVVKGVMESRIGNEYYSVGESQEMKINLEQKGENEYNIYLLGTNGERNYIEENLEAPFVFVRFYNEALFLKVMKERIEEYQEIFNEKLSEEEIYNIVK